MCCAICGSAFSQQDSTILIHDDARELEHVQEHYATKWGPCGFTTNRGINEAPATYESGPNFITQNGRRVTACCSAESAIEVDQYRIPVHNYCLDLAKYALRSRHSRLSSMRQLWKVLRMRCLASSANGQQDPLRRIDAPDNYHLPSSSAGAQSKDMDEQWYAADAWNIPNLTAGLVAQLQPVRSHAAQSQSAFRARFEKLPQEMQDHILSSVFSEPEFSSQCTKLVPQSVWMDMLLDDRIIPFLWDLDRETLERKVAEGQKMGVEWDFELLVRQLCQTAFNESSSCLAGMPAGLHNRRRIWKLLGEMYVGDYLPEAPSPASSLMGQPAAIPRYWNEEGDLQHPLVWMRREKAKN